ncbi:MAG TPA: hypothetical protein VGL56_04580 [Fimbriimonadaceae bacterium]|jgi:hypothetical protein
MPDSPFFDKHPIIVLGMLRSGTSSVTSALEKLGVYVGDKSDFFPADENNLGGYFEHRELVHMNRRILAAYRMAFNSVRPFPASLPELPQTELLVPELAAFIRAKFAGKNLWGFKQPLASPLIPVYDLAFKYLGLSPQYVLCVRNPLEVAASEAKWAFDGLSERFHAPFGELAYGLWLHYTLYPLLACLSQPLTVVMYDDFVERPRQSLEAIVANRSGWSPSEEQWAAAIGLIEGRMRRARSDLAALEGQPSVLVRCLDLCREASNEPGFWKNGNLDERITALWKEVGQLRKMFQEDPPTAGKLSVFFNKEGRTEEVFQSYLPEETWQTVKVSVPATGGSTVAAAIYPLPAVVWVRKAVWRFEGKEVAADLHPGPHGAKGAVGRYLNFSVVPEPHQLIITIPSGRGPFELEIEFYVETGFYVAVHALSRIARTRPPAQ